MPTNLRSALDALAQTFASSVLAAIRSASIDDLLAEAGGARPVHPGKAAPSPKPASKTRGGRLARRSAADIEKALASVVALVKKTKGGLRSEQIRKQLGLDVREVPRILKTGLSTKKLKAKGHKRATVYTAA